MPNVGDIIVFQPYAFERIARPINNKVYTPVSVRGTVIFVNAAHRYYTVEAQVNGCAIRESFRF